MKPSLAPSPSPAPVVAFLASLFLALTAAGVAAPAWAERADRDKPTNIEADHLVHDQAKRTSRFRGQVILTKGTLQIRADDLEVIEDEAGFQSASALGKPVRFRQKLEGSAGPSFASPEPGPSPSLVTAGAAAVVRAAWGMGRYSCL
ncbi:MAG: LptA/OstA family protein, partial [Betaproteobacteria bacterium]